jgi:threonine dehydratase
MSDRPVITLRDVQRAREEIADVAHVTPLLTSEQLSKACGNTMALKCEHLQRTGSFKIRGATNRVKEAARTGAKFVTAASSGNHGQAVAHIARRLGLACTVVVPEDAAACKVDAILADGGKIERCGTTSAARLPRAKALAEEMGGQVIPPYDDPFTMAGQGTIGLEILEQQPDVEAIVVPVGGGGLISGILAAVKESNPRVQVFGVEPELANDTFLSLQRGAITAIPATRTIADGLRSSQPGDLTFPVMQRYLDDLVLVSEDEIRQAMRFVLERMKQLIEPSAATTVAAAMFGKLPLKAKRVVAVISGGNVDLERLAGLVGEVAG